MADKDRIINREDGAAIINALNAIADNYPRYFEIPTLTQDTFETKGEEITVNILDYLTNYVEDRMILTGTTTTTTTGGTFQFSLQLKSVNDKWVDGTTEIKNYNWYVYGTDYAPFSSAPDSVIDYVLTLVDDGKLDPENDLGWTIGDERVVHLSAINAGTYNVAHAEQNVTLVIMDTDHYDLETPTESGQTKSKLVLGVKNMLAEMEKMEETNTNENGWDKSRGRKCCEAILNMFPDYIKSHLKSFAVKTAEKGNNDSATVITSYDKLSLFAEWEIFAQKTYSANSECNQLSRVEYYKTTANRIKYNSSGSADGWWLRSPYYHNGSYFCFVSGSGSANNNNANFAFGFSPFCCI